MLLAGEKQQKGLFMNRKVEDSYLSEILKKAPIPPPTSIDSLEQVERETLKTVAREALQAGYKPLARSIGLVERQNNCSDLQNALRELGIEPFTQNSLDEYREQTVLLAGRDGSFWRVINLGDYEWQVPIEVLEVVNNISRKCRDVAFYIEELNVPENFFGKNPIYFLAVSDRLGITMYRVASWLKKDFYP